MCVLTISQSNLEETLQQLEKRILQCISYTGSALRLSEEVVKWIKLRFVSQHVSPLSFLSFHFISHCWSHCEIRYTIVTVSLDKNMFSKQPAAEDESPENEAIVF